MGFGWKSGLPSLGLGSRVQVLAGTITALWVVLLLLGASSFAHEVACPLECECPKLPTCRPGVPLVMDSCGCCQVCAGQFNEICNVLRPCDQGLRCEQVKGHSAKGGICRVSRGRFKNRRLQSPGCTVKATEWSQCSKTCGVGTSTRRSNNNTKCQLKEETRLCQNRPCSMLNDLSPKEGSSCLKVYKEKVPKPLEYKNCTSLKMYKPKYCGMCHDRRCCQPSAVRTIKVRFHCPGSGTLVMQVAKIQRCECSRRADGCALTTSRSYDWKRSLRGPLEPQ